VYISHVRHNNNIIKYAIVSAKCISTYNCLFYYIIVVSDVKYTRVGTLIVATIYLQLIPDATAFPLTPWPSGLWFARVC